MGRQDRGSPGPGRKEGSFQAGGAVSPIRRKEAGSLAEDDWEVALPQRSMSSDSPPSKIPPEAYKRQERENHISDRGGQGGSALVERSTLESSVLPFENPPYLGSIGDRCQRCSGGVFDQNSQLRNIGDPSHQGQEGEHQCSRDRGSLSRPQGGSRNAEGTEGSALLRQRHNMCSSGQTGHAEAVSSSLEMDQEGHRQGDSFEHQLRSPSCPGKAKWGGGCSFQARRDERRMGGSIETHNRTVGFATGGSLWVDGEEDVSPRGLFLGVEAGPAETSTQKDSRDARAGSSLQREGETTRTPSHRETDGGLIGSHLEGNTLVAQADAAPRRPHKLGKTARPHVFPWSAWLVPLQTPCGQHPQGKRTLGLRWIHAEGRTEDPLEDSIEPFLQRLALRATGDTITRTSKALIRIKSTQLTEEGKQDLLKKARVLTREANGLNYSTPEAP